jgi:hypothetical protein
MAKKIRVWDGSAWQDVAPALPYTAVHSAQASMPSTAVDGQIWLDTDASVPSTTVTRWYKLPSAGTTTLSGNDDNSIPLAYTPGYEQVFLNGTLLSRSAADYTATTGTSIVLSSPIVAGDIVEIICPLQITTTDTYTQSAVNAAFQANTNNFAAGKNKIINGDFRINQRSFSTNTSGGYLVDRFYGENTGGTTTYSTQPFAAGAAPVTGYEGSNFLRLDVTGQSTNHYASINQRIEDVRTLAGQIVTLSFWAKSLSGAPKIGLYVLQEFGSGGSSGSGGYYPAPTISSSWSRYSVTFTMPSITGKTVGTSSYIRIGLSASDSYNPNQGVQATTIDFWGIQLEAGSNATAFQTATGTLQGELAACQRYTAAVVPPGTGSSYSKAGMGHASSSTQFYIYYQLPVVMRAIPTVLTYSGLSHWSWTNQVTGGSPTSMAIDTGSSSGQIAVLSMAVSGATAGSAYCLQANNNPSAQIIFSAEL